MNGNPQSWYDLALQSPVDIRALISDCYIGTSQGTFSRSTTFLTASWVASPHAFGGNVTCATLVATDALKVADAAQWTLAHKGVNTDATLPIPLRKLIFLRGGPDWQMQFDIAVTGNMTNPELTFRDNGSSPGDYATGGTGTFPVFTWTGTFT